MVMNNSTFDGSSLRLSATHGHSGVCQKMAMNGIKDAMAR
jgi:hypothetical protein